MKPPHIGSYSLYVYKDCTFWHHKVNTFLELRTNHRFSLDEKWGKLLQRFQRNGPTLDDVKMINARVIEDSNDLKESDIPDDICYAVRTNIDRNAINNAVFKKVVELSKHSKQFVDVKPKFTLCIKASEMKIKVADTKRTFKDMSHLLQNLIYTCCGDAHIRGGRGNTQRFDPLLKLYVGCPVMISENIDVANSMANGSMCKFVGLKLKSNVNMGSINIDGYYVNCVEANEVEYMVLELQEHKEVNQCGELIRVKPRKTNQLIVEIPIPGAGSPYDHRTERSKYTKIKFVQFPINISNARTVHKLRGRTIENLMIASFDYTDNWIYVAMSRVTTLGGLYLMKALHHPKCKGMSAICKAFHSNFRDNKKPNLY